RTSQPIELIDGTRANLCIDVGVIRAGRRRVALEEVELELSSGNPSGLFDFALTLAADLPLRVSQWSKAERGYALATGLAPEPRRAQQVALDAAATTTTALAAVATECLAHIGGNADALCAGADDEHLHQLRVGMRRLRCLLKLTTGIIVPARLDDVKSELRWLAGAVGPARDWDVLATQTLSPIATRLRSSPEWTALRRRIARRRPDASPEARSAIASPRFHRLLLLLGASFATLSGDGSATVAP